MATDVKMEDWADKSEAGEAAVSSWFKKPGNPVRQGDLLAELIVEKVNLEVEAPVTGILLEITAEVGQSVRPGAVVARIGTAEEWAALQAQKTNPPAPASPPGQQPVPVAPQPVALAEVVASPAAKRLLRENNLTLEEVAAFTGGAVRRIGEDEVKRYLGSRAASSAPGPNGAARPNISNGTGELVPYSGLRRVIGDRMSGSLREMAQLTITVEADITRLVARREALKAEGTALSYTALVARAVVLSLAHHPYLNAALEGDSIRLHSKINLGIAVNLDEGLVVPVIQDAGRRPVAELTAEVKRLGDLARRQALVVADSSGGTFTITNLGAYEVDVFTPIINPPQVAILGVGRIKERAGVVDGQVQVCKTLWLSLSFDHRIVDGAPAGAFLKEVRSQLEMPEELFS